MEAYLHYDAEDFLLDPSFQHFCLGSREEDIRFWNLWIAAHPDKLTEIQEARKLFVLLNGNNTEALFEQDREAFRAALHRHLSQAAPAAAPEGSRRRNVRPLLYITGIAASLLLAVMLSYSYWFRPSQIKGSPSQQNNRVYASLPGERKAFQLPDGSTVLLNAASTIRISKDFNASNREVSLEGEAFFDVTRNAQLPFIIHAGVMNVKVLGTKFDVKSYPGDKTAETVLIGGAVEVTLKNRPDEKVVLRPHEKVVVQNLPVIAGKTPDNDAALAAAGAAMPETLHVQHVTVSPSDSMIVETSWTKNRLVFDDETLSEVAAKLERWYGVEVKVDTGIAQTYRFTGTFENETIDQTLKALQLSLPFHYRKENEEIFITQ